MEAAIVEVAAEFRPQCVANTTWALATLSSWDAAAWDAMAERAATAFAEGKQEPQHLANTLWGFGKVSFSTRGVTALAVLLEKTKEELPNFNPQCLSNTAWATAALQLGDRQTMEEIAAHSILKMSKFRDQELANLVWGYATLVTLNRPLMAAAAVRAQHLQKGPQQMRDLANLSWAFARLQHFDAGLLETVAKAAVAGQPAEAGQEISSILWAFASFAVVHGPLVAVFSETLVQRIDEFSPQSLMMTAWSLSTLGVSDWSLMKVIADAARPRLEEFNELWIGSILWSIASCPVEKDEEEERKSYSISLAHAPILQPLGQWKGHKLCLLANALFQVKEDLPEIWCQVETRWTEELRDLSQLLLEAANDAEDVERYRLRIQSTELFHVGPFFTQHLLEMLGIREASPDFVTSARWSLERREAARGVACFACFDVVADGAGAADDGIFFTERGEQDSEACAEKRVQLVSVALNHDRSGHAELRAMQWLLQTLQQVGVCLDEASDRMKVDGHMSLHVTHYPCLSCLGALAQLRSLLPNLQLQLSFDWSPGAARGA